MRYFICGVVKGKKKGLVLVVEENNLTYGLILFSKNCVNSSQY